MTSAPATRCSPHPMIEAGLSLGSNMGDRLQNLTRARELIADAAKVSVLVSSPVYETEPVGVKDQYRDLSFLNAVLIVESGLEVEELSDLIHGVENTLGRERSEDRYAPRPIDVDILYAGDAIMNSPDITLPHPSWYKRRFVLQPLADVRSELVLPGQTLTCEQMLSSLPEVPEVVLFSEGW